MRAYLFLTTGLAFGASGFVVTLPLLAQTAPPPLTVALSGNAAPAGGNYGSFGAPVLNGSGQVAFVANLTGGASSAGIFTGTPGLLQAAALQGTAAPAGGNYSSFSTSSGSLVLNGSGQAVFFANLTGGSSNSGLFVGGPGTIQAAALQGFPSPVGVNYGSLSGTPVLNDSGQVAFFAGTPGGPLGVFVGVPGSILAAAVPGTAAPAGGNYIAFTAPVLNASGQVAFRANLNGVSPDSGLFVGSPGSMQAAALQGNPAPSGGNYGSFMGTATPTLNGSGQIAFIVGLTGGSSTSGLFVGAPGSIQTAALLGNAAPSGGNYSTFSGTVLNGSGQMAFIANLTGGSSSEGLFVGTLGSFQAAALKGSVAPAGGNYTSFSSNPVLNGTGQVAFTANLAGGLSTQGLFAGSVGRLVKVVLVGDVVNVASGGGFDERLVSSISFLAGSGGQDGKGMPFNSSGLLCYELFFSDGSSGIFTSQIAPVPEPTLPLLMVGLSGLLVYRRLMPK